MNDIVHMCVCVCLCLCDFKKVKKKKNQNPNGNWVKLSLEMYKGVRGALFLSFASEESPARAFRTEFWR